MADDPFFIRVLDDAVESPAVRGGCKIIFIVWFVVFLALVFLGWVAFANGIAPLFVAILVGILVLAGFVFILIGAARRSLAGRNKDSQ